MITRIEVDGFKSLRGFSLELSPLTAILGVNGAGKSNLFDALNLLSRLATTSVTEALKGGRGAIRDQFSRLAEGPADRIRISTELLLDVDDEERYFSEGKKQTRVRHEVEIERTPKSSGVEDISIGRERIGMLRQAEDPWIAARPELAPMAHYQEQDDLLIEAVGEELRGFRFVHLEPSRLRLPSDRAAGSSLAADGSNLPTALAALAPDVRLQIRADLAELIPGFRSFEVVPSDEELRLEIEFTDGARVPARVLSDGTLRLVALLTLLRSSRPGAVIALEEPENGIYPGRLRALIEKLVDATSPQGGVLPPQVLLTSHSPAILAALHDRPETLVLADLVRRGAGLRSTRMRHVGAGGGAPRDSSVVSMAEIERILDAARPEEEA